MLIYAIIGAIFVFTKTPTTILVAFFPLHVLALALLRELWKVVAVIAGFFESIGESVFNDASTIVKNIPLPKFTTINRILEKWGNDE